MTVLEDLRAQLALSRAAELARQGDLDAAAAALTALDDAGAATPEVLDLLARIRAQQQRWSDADAYWARVQQLRADDSAAAVGRETVAAIVAGRRRARPLAPLVGAVAGAVVLAALVGVGVTRLTGGQPDAQPVAQSTNLAGTPTPTADPRAEAERERADQLARQLAAIEAERNAAAAALANKLELIARKVAGPGVIVQRQSGAARILFEQGLFSYDTVLTPSAPGTLNALGKRLTGVEGAITVVGHSVAVPGRTSGGSTTALARARTATRELSAASGFPLSRFSLQAADQRESPFPTDTRNRTVTLLITPY